MHTKTHILVIRLSAMGDVAMTVPVIRAFVQQHPSVKITFLSKPFLTPLFEDIPNVSFYAADVMGKHKGFPGLLRLHKELKNLGVTHVADLHNVLRSKILRLNFKLSGFKVAYIDKGRAEKKALTRSKNKVFKQLKTSHQRYADVFESLGFLVGLDNPAPVSRSTLSKKSLALTGEKQGKWVGIAPFAAFDGKTYPLRLMEEVISQIQENNVRLFLFGGGEKEIALLRDIENKFSNVLNLAGTLSLKDELNVISQLDLMVSMDSGNAHLAAMQQVKTVTIWGVTHPYAGFAPFKQPLDYCVLPDLKKYPGIPCSIYGNKVYPGYENVMASIHPSVISAKIKTILDI
ncbi:glycosyltransferase family 9 protein [Flavobacteriaceae bacterium S356]|uniref:Glycosyltransferase family 9 protein n=1 Tax=Asprobacillus argus TaxID=3076534 RepID=A0ABU3LDA7_9FLAO|nr:glycosyltransferase family 9 protein [Flavobacteriaceae bacterium S356]